MKNMLVSIESSLKKLRTSYIDIFYVNWWDHDTSIEEVINGLHNLIAQGKVLYPVRDIVERSSLAFVDDVQGVSDTPAWVVAKANTYARMTGKTPFSIYQGHGLSLSVILNERLFRCAVPKVLTFLHELAFK
jgi:hypothetical protein